MTSLAQRQAWLLEAICDGLSDPAEAPRHLAASPALDATTRLRIYQNAYRARLLQSFHAMYPGLLCALGAALLDAFALDFLRQHPPRHYSVNRVANGFDEHLRQTRPASELEDEADWADFIIDLARLETMLLDVSEAGGLEDSPAPDVAALRDLSHTQLMALRPRPAPCLRAAAFRFPVHAYLQALREGRAPAMPSPRDTWLALTRVDYRLSTRELAPVQWELLRRFDGEATVDSALREVAALDLRPAPTAELARIWLANFAQQGLLVRS